MALIDLKEHCRERSESSNLGFDEEFDKLSQVVSMSLFEVEHGGEDGEDADLYESVLQVGRKQDTTAGYLTLNR